MAGQTKPEEKSPLAELLERAENKTAELVDEQRQSVPEGWERDKYDIKTGVLKGLYHVTKRTISGIIDLATFTTKLMQGDYETQKKVGETAWSVAKFAAKNVYYTYFAPPDDRMKYNQEMAQLSENLYNAAKAKLTSDWNEAASKGKEKELVANWVTQGIAEIALFFIPANELAKASEASKAVKGGEMLGETGKVLDTVEVVCVKTDATMVDRVTEAGKSMEAVKAAEGADAAKVAEAERLAEAQKAYQQKWGQGLEKFEKRVPLKEKYQDLVRKDPDAIWSKTLKAETRQAVDDFKAGKKIMDKASGKEYSYGEQAKNLRLEGKTASQLEKEMLDKGFTKHVDVIRDPKTKEPILHNGQPVRQDIYTHPDGSMVRIKPEGHPDSPRQPPHVSKAVRNPPDGDYRDWDQEGFKVDNDGNAIPKAPGDGPYAGNDKTVDGMNYNDGWADSAHTFLAPE